MQAITNRMIKHIRYKAESIYYFACVFNKNEHFSLYERRILTELMCETMNEEYIKKFMDDREDLLPININMIKKTLKRIDNNKKNLKLNK